MTFSAIYITSCSQDKRNEVPNNAPVVVDKYLPEDFIDFYAAFHENDSFQLSHIVWPLQGKVIKDAETGELLEATWQKDNWVLHRNMVLGTDFNQVFQVIDPELIFEEIRARAGNYTIQRRFAKLGDEWTLIFYRATDLSMAE